MTLKKVTYEGTNGAAITNGYQGITLVSSGSSTAVFDTAAAFDGSTGATFTADGTNASYAQAPFNASASVGAVSGAVKIPASVPASDYVLGSFYDTANARILSVVYRTTGTVVLSDKSSTYTTLLSAAQAVAGTKFRIEIGISALSATVGAYTAQAFNSANTAVGTNVSVTNANLGTTAMSYFRHGCSVITASYPVSWDSIQTNDGSAAQIGRLASNTTVPTIDSISANQTVSAAGSTVNLTASATAYNGDTIASWAWSFVDCISSAGAAITPPTITGATTANPSFVLPATKGRYRLQAVVTDSSGNVSLPATTKVFFPDTTFAPIEVVSQSGVVGAIGTVVDASDGTVIDLGAPGSGNSVVYRLSPIVANPSSFSLTVRDLVTATGGTQRVELLDGDATTVRKNWGGIAPSTTMADQPESLSGAEIATVTNWNELCVRLTQV